MDEVAAVKSRLEIAEVVGTYLPLKQAGRNLKAPCPFHQEKSASFMVSPEKGIYHCFGCGEGGDIFNFVMKMEGMDFRQALEWCARRAGVELKARSGENREASRLKARLLEAHEWAVKYFQASLLQNKPALEYVVRGRRLGRETIRSFQIGYAPDSWNALTDFLVSKGFNHKELLQGGLAGQREGRSTIYDLFRGRVMFTICDREGRPIGFTGRVLDDSLPKYLNTPQTPLYDKSSAIFGLHLAKAAIREADEVVLVEGNMDVIASHQAGVHQVVAASGTALTLDQLRTLSKLTKRIKLAFDMDRAGILATERVVPMAQTLGLNLYVVQIEGAKDADELIGIDPAAWTKAIAEAREIREYWLDRSLKDFDLSSMLEKKQFIDRVAYIAQLYADPSMGDALKPEDRVSVEQRIFLDKAAGLAEIETSTMLMAMNKADLGEKVSRISRHKSSAQSRPEGAEPFQHSEAITLSEAKKRYTSRDKLEESVLALAIKFPATRISLADLRPDDVSTDIRRSLLSAMQEGKEPVDDDAHRTYIQRLLLVVDQEFSEVTEAEAGFESFSLVQRLVTISGQELKIQLTKRMQVAEQSGDADGLAKLMSEYQGLLNRDST